MESSLAELQQAYANAALTQDELNKAYLEIENARNELTSTKQELENIVGIRTDIIGALQSAFNNSSMSVDAQTGSITFSSDVLFPYGSSALSAASQSTLREIIPMYLHAPRYMYVSRQKLNGLSLLFSLVFPEYLSKQDVVV